MTKWIGEWIVLSMLMVLGSGMLFILWAIWPLLPDRLPSQLITSVNPEGLVAMLMLVVVLGGFGKLMVGRG
jgi:hypothetical protein